ncbi:MAG: hypothetical protein MR860_03895 [Prevotella sp.]|nr:hypothetical protein [Prevotella sp.]
MRSWARNYIPRTVSSIWRSTFVLKSAVGLKDMTEGEALLKKILEPYCTSARLSRPSA